MLGVNSRSRGSRRLGSVTLLVIASCGGPSSDAPGDGGVGDVGVPEARCDAPPLSDISTPTTVIGDGTPASCTAAALQAAADAGGTIVFACGPSPLTLTVAQAIVFARETVIDGGGLVTLSGGGSSRIFYLDSDYNTPTPRLVVQRLAFRDGRGPATGDDTAQGGGAIYRDGGSLTVIDSSFDNNHASATGQDVAGGAIYGFGGGETVVVGSTFTNNAASDGGAIGSLNGDLTVINSTLAGNAATGTGGNPGDGGAGGAIYMDGGDEVTTLCGVTIADNTAGAIGGGVFRVSNDHTGSFAMAKSTVNHNRVTAADSGNAGGLYLEGLSLGITTSTISRNEAFFNGGIWINICQVQLTNVTIANNTALGSNGGGIWLGSSLAGNLLNCTIADNQAVADGQVAGAIFGEGLTLVNTIVAGNSAMYQSSCNASRSDGSGNLQWPEGSPCTDAPLVADPLLDPFFNHAANTETLVPAAASPARGIGTGCPATDQLGNPRAAACTAGAVEVP
jgi:parallel beta-helix repeat protein